MGDLQKRESLGNTCIVCASDIDNVSRWNTLGPCNHPGTCSVCSLRLRILSKDKRCCLCKSEMEQVICIAEPNVRFQSFNMWGNDIGPDHAFDDASAMFLPKSYIPFVKDLRSYSCDLEGCKSTFPVLPQLKSHLKSKHSKSLCDLCLKFNRLFIKEHQRFSEQELKEHHRRGDPSIGFSGHPLCEFCRSRFYSQNELYEHLMRNHYECHICQRRLNIHNRYYNSYSDLEHHFRNEHHLCEQPSCLEKKFVVFADTMELKAHMIADHPEIPTSRHLQLNFRYKRSVESVPDGRQGGASDGTQGSPTLASIDLSGSARATQTQASPRLEVADFPALSTRETGRVTMWNSSSRVRGVNTVDENEFPSLGGSRQSQNAWTYDMPPADDFGTADADLRRERNRRGRRRKGPQPVEPPRTAWGSSTEHQTVKSQGDGRPGNAEILKVLCSGDRARLTELERTHRQFVQEVILRVGDLPSAPIMPLTDVALHPIFEQGDLTASDYYDQVLDPKDAETLKKVFPKLLASLEDSNLKRNLLQIHGARMKLKTASSGEVVSDKVTESVQIEQDGAQQQTSSSFSAPPSRSAAKISGPALGSWSSALARSGVRKQTSLKSAGLRVANVPSSTKAFQRGSDRGNAYTATVENTSSETNASSWSSVANASKQSGIKSKPPASSSQGRQGKAFDPNLDFPSLPSSSTGSTRPERPAWTNSEETKLDDSWTYDVGLAHDHPGTQGKKKNKGGKQAKKMDLQSFAMKFK